MSIEVILLRHATAESRIGAQTDRERSLSGIGLLEAERMKRAIGCVIHGPLTIVISPYKRTIQTSSYFDGDKHIDIRLGAERSAKDVLDVVREYASEGSPLLVVGHLPLLDDAVALMVGASDTGIAYVPCTAVFVQLGSKSLLRGEISGVLAPWMLTQTNPSTSTTG